MNEAVGRTDPGRCRPANEDAFLVDLEERLFAIADGMGGHQAGEVASRMVVDTVGEFVRQSRVDRQITWPFGLDARLSFPANQLKNAVQFANQRVFYAARRRAELQGMGSTVVAALLGRHHAVYASVGDSRLYLLRDGRLRQLSTDDSWAASMVRAGADPAAVGANPMRHLLTSALGANEVLDVKVQQADLAAGDVLLLCSDGLHGLVPEAELAAIATGAPSLEAAAAALIDRANAAGGPDNVTVVLVRHDEARPDAAKLGNV